MADPVQRLSGCQQGRTYAGWWPSVIASLLLLTAAAAANAAEAPSLPIEYVQVEIRIGADRVAIVHEHYRFRKAVTFDLRYLTGPCSDVSPGSISVTAPAGPIEFAGTPTGPWVLLTRAPAHDAAAEYWVSYRVPVSIRTMNIPVVLPSHVLEPPTGTSTSVIDIHVVFPSDGDEGAVILPQMRPENRAGVWFTKMVALPSFVRVRDGAGSLADECRGSASGSEEPTSASASSSSGSLEWWMLAFVASLVAWVAFYMRWANARLAPSKHARNS